MSFPISLTKAENFIEKLARQIDNRLQAAEENAKKPNVNRTAEFHAQAIVGDDVEFRKLKERLRASKVVTNVGIQQMLPQLMEVRIKEKKETNSLRKALGAVSKLSALHCQGNKVTLKSRQTFCDKRATSTPDMFSRRSQISMKSSMILSSRAFENSSPTTKYQPAKTSKVTTVSRSA